MYDYISGKVATLTPTQIVIDNGGIGYSIAISLQTYSALEGKTEVKLYVCQIIRDDAHLLYGFYAQDEREMFLNLISVSGVGAATARLIISSLSVAELKTAIATENINVIKQVKGIGIKTAQRIVVDLKDKITKLPVDSAQLFAGLNNTSKQEALSALVMLGFAKAAAEKTLDQIIKSEGSLPVELLIKHALKRM